MSGSDALPGSDASRSPGADVGCLLPAAAERLDPDRVELDATQSGRGFEGWLELTFARSPYGVSVSPEGSYLYDIRLQVRSQRRLDDETLIGWAATRDLQSVRKLGPLDDDLSVTGRIEWNKFLVFVTSESSAEVESWRGPILLTGLSPSGRMHTMAGHGIFEAHGIGC